MNNRTVYYPSLRIWYELAISSSGLTSPSPAYEFSSGFTGNAIAQSFINKNQETIGVISMNIFGHAFVIDGPGDEDSSFKLIARDLIDSWNKLEIATELSKTIYFDQNETEEETLAKANEIK